MSPNELLKRVGSDIVEALRDLVTNSSSNRNKKNTDAVRLSELKRRNIERYVDQSVLPKDPSILPNAMFWGNIREHRIIPERIVESIDEAFERVTEILEGKGLVKRGGPGLVENVRIPVKPIGCSGGRRSPIPLDADHLFRLMPIISRSEATLAVY